MSRSQKKPDQKFPLTLIVILGFLMVALLWRLWPIAIGLAGIYFLKSVRGIIPKYITALLFILISLATQVWWENYLQGPQSTSNVPSPTPTTTPSSNNSDTFYVEEIVDGDTIRVTYYGTSKTVRLIGLDTPESKDPRKEVECFALEATKELTNLLTGRAIYLESDETQGDTDKYNRLLRYVFLPDGTHINEIMIKEGYGYEYTYDTPYKYRNIFIEAQNYAQNNNLGLWSSANCPMEVETPPDTVCDCTNNLYDCTDFTDQVSAQQCYESCGGRNNDIHKLDGNNDGVVCSTLP